MCAHHRSLALTIDTRYPVMVRRHLIDFRHLLSGWHPSVFRRVVTSIT